MKTILKEKHIPRRVVVAVEAQERLAPRHGHGYANCHNSRKCPDVAVPLAEEAAAAVAVGVRVDMPLVLLLMLMLLLLLRMALLPLVGLGGRGVTVTREQELLLYRRLILLERMMMMMLMLTVHSHYRMLQKHQHLHRPHHHLRLHVGALPPNLVPEVAMQDAEEPRRQLILLLHRLRHHLSTWWVML